MAKKPTPPRNAVFRGSVWVNPRTGKPLPDQQAAWNAWNSNHDVSDRPNQRSVVKLPQQTTTTVPKIPPYQGSKSLTVSQNTALAQILNKYQAWNKSGYIKTVVDAANYWKVDPVELLATLVFENTSADPNAVNKKSGATGLAQIVDTVVRKDLNPTRYAEFVRQFGSVTANFAKNPNAAINYMAWRMAGTRGQYASLDDWYRSPGYNPGFTGDSRGSGPGAIIRQDAPKYVPTPVTTVAQSAAQSVATTQAKDVLVDPYVAKIVKNNKMITTGDPKKALVYNGLPVRRSDFLATKHQLEDTFVTYTGQRPSNAQVQTILRNNWGDYTVLQKLSQKPGFFKSPIWKQKAPAFQAAAKDLTPDGKVSRDLVRTAIVNGWTTDVLQAQLRKRTEYVKSNEFKANAATLTNVHMSIMGVPDPNGVTAIKEAALAGWSLDQYAAWLRAQPNYTTSPEYREKTLSFLDQLGLITGKQTVLIPGAQDDNLNPNVVGALPNDKRIPGAGAVDAVDNLVGGYSRT